jgi:hypothetical protein
MVAPCTAMERNARDRDRPRGPTSRRDKFLASIDIDDPSTFPSDPLPWQIAAIREARRLLELDVAADEATPHVIDEADEGMPPPGRVLVANGEVHTRYKKGGGYVRYVVPSSQKVSCEVAGCCDPRRPLSAGRE